MDFALARIVPSKDRLLVLWFSLTKEGTIISIRYLHFSNSFRNLAGDRRDNRYNPISSSALYASLRSRLHHDRMVMPTRVAMPVGVSASSNLTSLYAL